MNTIIMNGITIILFFLCLAQTLVIDILISDKKKERKAKQELNNSEKEVKEELNSISREKEL